MHKKIFTNYIEFLQFAFLHKDDLRNISFASNRLLKFSTKTYRCEFTFDTGGLSPNKFAKELGVQNYSSFVHCCLSKIKDFETKDNFKLWKNGFFGGLIGINQDIINKYCGSGEINTFFDYDINSAYLYTLTEFLPTKFVKKITYEEYLQIKEIDKIPYIYFFEIEVNKYNGEFLSSIGTIRQKYKHFDFLNSKQSNEMIVSEKRLSLIQQIYFTSGITKKSVYVFEKHKMSIYKKIVFEYMKQKNKLGANFKKNALKLYGCLGQLKKRKVESIGFDNDILYVKQKEFWNEIASPQISMWVADSVAEKIFNIIDTNFDKILSWNTDGLTAISPLNLQIGKNAGQFKFNKIIGFPLLPTSESTRLVYFDIIKKDFAGSDCCVCENGRFFQQVTTGKSDLKKGYVEETRNYELKISTTFDSSKTLRSQIAKEKLKNIIYEKEVDF